MPVDILKQPMAASPEEIPQIKRLNAVFSVGVPDLQYSLTDSAGNQIVLPKSVFHVLIAVARAMADGQSISIIHYNQALTTQQSAEILQVSRPYLIQLLEQGKIPYEKVGTHRRIRMRDVLRYKEERDKVREEALEELGRVSEALGLYDEEDSEPGTQEQ